MISKTGTSTQIKIGECLLGNKDGGIEILAEQDDQSMWRVEYTLNIDGNIYHEVKKWAYYSDRDAIADAVKDLALLYLQKSKRLQRNELMIAGIDKLKALYPPRMYTLFDDETMDKMTRRKELIDYI